MKTKAICSFFVLFAIVAGMITVTPAAFADPHGIETADTMLAAPGCLDEDIGCYTPNTITVDVGHIVTMTNTDETGVHTFTSGTVDGFAATPDDKFDSGILSAGDSFEYNADTVGEYPYYCMLHVWMQGTLIVQEAAAEEEMQMEETMMEETVEEETEGGGCLIATATFGSELAPQVQQLRELRDNQLLNTESGISFINSFNDFYYSFSPYIADYERENPVFREMVKIAITPMISSLSILNYVDMNSEIEVLGYGISLIILNGMMYVGIPASMIILVRRF